MDVNANFGERTLVHGEDRKHNVPFREIAKVPLASLQTFGWRAGSGWVVAQADS